jgi:hypothetical protein
MSLHHIWPSFLSTILKSSCQDIADKYAERDNPTLSLIVEN